MAREARLGSREEMHLIEIWCSARHDALLGRAGVCEERGRAECARWEADLMRYMTTSTHDIMNSQGGEGIIWIGYGWRFVLFKS